MSNIIALEGRPSNGKSTTIGLLYESMKQDNYEIIQDRKRRGSKEFFVIVEKKGKKIGVTTYGDNPDLIRMRIDFFIAQGCHIIVIACRPSATGDRTRETIESYAGFTKEFIPKTVEADPALRTAVNQADANVLLESVERNLN